MNKQKVFSVLSLMGVVYILFLGIGYIRTLNSDVPLYAHKTEVPELLERQFNKVTVKNRAQPMTPVTFMTPKGDVVDWSAFEGQYLLVNFWATWCAPCVIELPSLDLLKQRYAGKGLEVISVSLDMGRSHDQIKSFLLYRDIGDFAAYLDHESQISKGIKMRGIPTTYLLDRQGNIRYIFEGDADWASPPAITFFDALLSPPVKSLQNS